MWTSCFCYLLHVQSFHDGREGEQIADRVLQLHSNQDDAIQGGRPLLHGAGASQNIHGDAYRHGVVPGGRVWVFDRGAIIKRITNKNKALR